MKRDRARMSRWQEAIPDYRPRNTAPEQATVFDVVAVPHYILVRSRKRLYYFKLSPFMQSKQPGLPSHGKKSYVKRMFFYL